MNKILIASFDIGKKNFAFVIEEIYIDELKKLKPPKYKSRYTITGEPSTEFESFLPQLYTCGKIILVENLDLTKNCDKRLYLDPKVFINMIETLDKYKSYWDKCSAFIIEKQMCFGKNKNNIMALKLGQHCYSYFTFLYRDTKEIIEFPAYHKTQILGAPKKITKPQRKKWAVDIVLEILQLRCDEEILTKIKTKQKRDDMADCFLMTICYSFLKFVDKKL